MEAVGLLGCKGEGSKLDMELYAGPLIAALLLAAVTGCSSVSQQQSSQRQDEAATVQRAIDFQRQCDAGAGGNSLSLLTQIRCKSGTPLPPECEKADTNDLPACREWFRKVNAVSAAPGWWVYP